MLKELAAEAQGFECTSDTIEPCDRVDCVQEVLGMEYSAMIVLLPCTTPASLTIEMSEGETVLVDETLSQSKNITVKHDILLVITLDPFKDAIGLQVSSMCLQACICGMFLVPCRYTHYRWNIIVM